MSNSSANSTPSSDDDYNPESVLPQKVDAPSTVSELTSPDDISHLPSKPSPHSNVKEENQVEMFKKSFFLSNNDETKSNTDNEHPISSESIATKSGNDNNNDNDSASDASPLDKEVDVPLFNSVIQFFISSPLLNDPQFNSLTPSDKEYVVLKAYNDSNNLQESIKINFAATTSYNKSHLKPNEERQLLVPINPYCLRPDLTQPMSTGEQVCYDDFKKENERFFRESECSHFPPGSRLFVGNLAVNTLNIADVFRVFHPYGKIKSVNLKQGYGFVQFTTADACNLAIKCEQNVPLHNRFMHLQISKQHDKNSERNQHREERRTRDRERERSPVRNNNNIRERSPLHGSNKIQVIITNESEPSFNHLMVNSLNEVGLETNIKHVESTAEELSQQTIFDCAYTGVIAVIITTKLELVNLVLFEKNEDDAIKFDEYADISMESAVNWILNSAKKSKSGNGNDSNTNNHSHNNNNNNGNNSNYNHNNNNNNRRGRVQNSNQQLYNNDRRQRDRGGRNKNNDNRNRNNKKSFYASPQDQGNQYNTDQYSSYRPDANNQPSSYYGQPQTFPQQPPPSTDVASQLANSLKSMDPNSINTMLSFVQQLQQPQPQQQQQQQPPPPPLSQPQPQQQYIPQQQPSGPGVVLGNLLNQLQTSPSGINPPPPNYMVQQPQHHQYQSNPSYAYSNGYSQQQPPPSHSQQQQYYPPLQQMPPVTTQASQPQRQPQDDKDGDDASKLFETLARLKNNM